MEKQLVKVWPTLKQCPMCAEQVQASARICRFCRHEFEAARGTNEGGAPAPEEALARALEEQAAYWKYVDAGGPEEALSRALGEEGSPQVDGGDDSSVVAAPRDPPAARMSGSGTSPTTTAAQPVAEPEGRAVLGPPGRRHRPRDSEGVTGDGLPFVGVLIGPPGRRHPYGVLAMMVVGGAVALAVWSSRRNSAEEAFRRADAETAARDTRARKFMAENAAAEQAAEAQRQANIEEARRETQRRQAQDEAERARFQAMTPGGRVQAIKDLCKDTCSQTRVHLILEAAANPTERSRLKTLAEAEEARVASEEARRARKEGAGARAAFAELYETQLLENHMNPDGVSANGTTLVIRGWFCSRQYTYDIQSGLSDQARRLGFKRIECDNALGSWWLDL